MKDEKNTKNASAPFNGDPFSVDVWERAYKNAGRPFEKKAFDFATAEDASDAEVSLSGNDAKADAEAHRKISPQKDNKTGKNLSSSYKAPTSRSVGKPTVDMPSYKVASNSSPSAQQETYIQKSDVTKATNRENEEDEPENVLDMIENAIDGFFSDPLGKIKEFFHSEKMGSKGIMNIIWVVIAIIFFAIIGLLGGL